MENRLSHQKRALHRFTLAQTAFRQARLLCSHIESLDLNNKDEIASSLMAGVVVSYVRPFLRNDGVGSLPGKFSKFGKDEPFGKYHDILIEARHWVYAHRDNQNAPNLNGGTVSDETVSEVILTLRKDGYSVSINEPQISTKQLINFGALCAYQHNRINEAVGDLIISIMENHKIREGVYRITDKLEPIS